jgi:hypothetical protein
VKGKPHDLNHDLTFSAHTINYTINCVCHSIRSMFRVLGTYNFGSILRNYGNPSIKIFVGNLKLEYPAKLKNLFGMKGKKE